MFNHLLTIKDSFEYWWYKYSHELDNPKFLTMDLHKKYAYPAYQAGWEAAREHYTRHENSGY
jgi:hypothetical protein